MMNQIESPFPMKKALKKSKKEDNRDRVEVIKRLDERYDEIWVIFDKVLNRELCFCKREIDALMIANLLLDPYIAFKT